MLALTDPPSSLLPKTNGYTWPPCRVVDTQRFQEVDQSTTARLSSVGGISMHRRLSNSREGYPSNPILIATGAFVKPL